MAILKGDTGRGAFQFELALVLFALLTPALASPRDKSTVLASPDHPAVWYVYDYDKLGQNLHWDDRNQSLVADVTYSLVPAENDWNPADYRTFILHFPGVQFNAVENTLYFRDGHKHKVILGHIEPGIFGKQVVLGKGIELSAHRHLGALNGALLVNRTGTP